jgi:hypothetical protein
LLEQQSGVLSQQDVSAEEAAGYYGSVPLQRAPPPRPLDSVSEYDDNDGYAYNARHHPGAGHEHSSYHYYTDEGYAYNAASRRAETDDDDGDDVEREEDAYIRGDAAYFQQQEQAGHHRHDDGADEYRRHPAQQQLQQHRARTAGESSDLQRFPADAPEARAATSQHTKASSSQASDASEPLRYQEPVVAFTEYAAAPSHRHAAGAAPQQQHQPQPPAQSQKTTKHASSRASLHSTATGASTTSNRSTKGAQPPSEETPMQAARRRQQLEAAVETWLQGEDDTTLAAKAELLTPAPSPARSKLPPPAVTAAAGAAANAKKKPPAQAGDGDGDSSDWSSDDDVGAANARAVTFAARRPPNAATFDESDGDDSEYGASNVRSARHPRSTSKPAATTAAAPKRSVQAASTAASEQFRANSRRADTPEDASDVSDLTDQEDQRRRRATDRQEQRLMPDVARPAGNDDRRPTLPLDRPPNAGVCVGVRDGAPQPSIGRRGPQQSSPPKPFLGGPPAPAIVPQPSASSPTNLSGPSSGRKPKRAKPFQRLPVIPIAPYNPVPANY